MAIIIAQVGDIHFRGDNDIAIDRAAQLGAAIAAEVTPDVSCIVFALCGDIANTGASAEFAIAPHFVELVEAPIKKCRSGLPIIRIIVPGNHDCNLAGDQAARDAILNAVSEATMPPKSIQDILLQPLKSYFECADALVGSSNGITSEHPFYTSVDVADEDATVRIHLLNTAWMSSRHERPGTLLFPLAAISPPLKPAAYSLAILHHPLNWFSQPNAMRPLRDRLAQIASLVLVNHEHMAEAKAEVDLYTRDPTVAKTIYIPGGVIQEANNPNICTFNLIRIDVPANALNITRHEFEAANPAPHFIRSGEAVLSLVQNTATSGQSGYALTDAMASFLDDPGAPVLHPRRDPRIPIKLSEIFLYPDLWELDEEHKGDDQKQIRSHNVLEEIFRSSSVLITGSEKSGRTSLVKQLYLEAFRRGKTPIYLSGKDIPKKQDKFRGTLRAAVVRQYINLNADAFEQLPPESRVILVDDIHQMPISANLREDLLLNLSSRFGHVILIGDDLIKLDELKGKDASKSGLWGYRHLVILGFGDFLRERFVRQWLTLTGDLMPGDDELDTEVDRLCDILNAVVKRQLLPTHPLFLLVELQQSDAAKASVQGGSFGHLFEGVVTAILSKSAFTRITIGDKYHYLAALARKMFDCKQTYLRAIDCRPGGSIIALFSQKKSPPVGGLWFLAC